MDIVKVNDLAVIKTAKEFIIIIKDKIHGPFPSTPKMCEAILNLLENPGSEEAVERCRMAKRCLS